MGWNRALPITGTNVSQTPTIYQQNWTSLEDFMDMEHNTMTSVNSGKHVLGAVGVLAEGTSAFVNPLSACTASGAVAFDTSHGTWIYNVGLSSWLPVSVTLPTTRIHATLFIEPDLAASTTTVINFNASIDTLHELPGIAGIFVAKDTGFFLIDVQVGCRESVTTGGSLISMLLSGSDGIYRTCDHITRSNNYSTLHINTIAKIVSGGTIATLIRTPVAPTKILVDTALVNTFMNIYRVS